MIFWHQSGLTRFKPNHHAAFKVWFWSMVLVILKETLLLVGGSYHLKKHTLNVQKNIQVSHLESQNDHSVSGSLVTRVFIAALHL